MNILTNFDRLNLTLCVKITKTAYPPFYWAYDHRNYGWKFYSLVAKDVADMKNNELGVKSDDHGDEL